MTTRIESTNTQPFMRTVEEEIKYPKKYLNKINLLRRYKNNNVMANEYNNISTKKNKNISHSNTKYNFKKNLIDFFCIDTNKPSKKQADIVKKQMCEFGQKF